MTWTLSCWRAFFNEGYDEDNVDENKRKIWIHRPNFCELNVNQYAKAQAIMQKEWNSFFLENEVFLEVSRNWIAMFQYAINFSHNIKTEQNMASLKYKLFRKTVYLPQICFYTMLLNIFILIALIDAKFIYLSPSKIYSSKRC